MGVWGQIEHDVGALVLIVVFAVVAYVLRKVGVLPFSPTEKAAAARADRAEHELAEANKRIGQLEQTRSMRPILEQLAKNAELQAQVLDRLAHHNGSFKHIEEALAAVRGALEDHAEGMKALTGTIADLHGIPLKPPS